MRHKYILTFSLSILFGTTIFGIAHGAANSVTYVKAESEDTVAEEAVADTVTVAEPAQAPPSVAEPEEEPSDIESEKVDLIITEEDVEPEPDTSTYTVPFYSQFTDISAPEWRKIGCGIASLAMLIDFYSSEEITVDGLLSEGITANAYTGDAGWSHAGLIGLAKDHGLSGEAVYMSDLTMPAAFSNLEDALKDGPVMVSVHYTFKPTNPIPHLVIVTGVENGEVHYNDPAEKAGNGSISIQQFQSAWKKRYIAIRG